MKFIIRKNWVESIPFIHELNENHLISVAYEAKTDDSASSEDDDEEVDAPSPSSNSSSEESEEESSDEKEPSDKRTPSDGDATTASYSSLEDEEADQLNNLAAKYRVDNVDLGNGNKIICKFS